MIEEGPFPIGMASSNRMISLAQGLIENNIPVKVICIRPTERPELGIKNKSAIGKYNGIEYIYPCGTTIRGQTFLIRRWHQIKSVIKSILILYQCNKNDILLIYLASPLYLLCFYLISRSRGLRYIIDKSEYPFVLFNKSLIGKWYAYLYVNLIYRLFDAMIVMTKPLEAYFQDKIRRRAKLLHIPMTVDSTRFLNNTSTGMEISPYIAYCGYLGGNKDGVSILIRSFYLISKKYTHYKLYVIGDSPDTNDFENLRQMARALDLEDRIVFTGRVHRDEIPRYLCNASVLALARPSSLQSSGGFPTKLGEYLSTGKPVIVTSVGDIPVYLKDGNNAFIAQPDSAEAFAEKMDYVLSNPELAKKVGAAGRQTAMLNFDYKVQANKLAEFFTSFATSR